MPGLSCSAAPALKSLAQILHGSDAAVNRHHHLHIEVEFLQSCGQRTRVIAGKRGYRGGTVDVKQVALKEQPLTTTSAVGLMT